MKKKMLGVLLLAMLALSSCGNDSSSSGSKNSETEEPINSTSIETTAETNNESEVNEIIEGIVEGYQEAEEHTKFVSKVLNFKTNFAAQITNLDTAGYKVDENGNVYKWNETPEGFISISDKRSKFRNTDLDVNGDDEAWHQLYDDYLSVWDNICTQYKELSGKDISGNLTFENESNQTSSSVSDEIINSIVAGYQEAEEHTKFVSKVLNFRNNFDVQMTNLDVAGFRVDEKGNVYRWKEIPEDFLSITDKRSKFRNTNLDVKGDDEAWHQLYDEYLNVWANICKQYKELTGKDISGNITIE